MVSQGVRSLMQQASGRSQEVQSLFWTIFESAVSNPRMRAEAPAQVRLVRPTDHQLGSSSPSVRPGMQNSWALLEQGHVGSSSAKASQPIRKVDCSSGVPEFASKRPFCLNPAAAKSMVRCVFAHRGHETAANRSDATRCRTSRARPRGGRTCVATLPCSKLPRFSSSLCEFVTLTCPRKALITTRSILETDSDLNRAGNCAG